MEQYKGYIPRYNTLTDTWDQVNLTKDQRIEFLQDTIKLPGDQGLDSRVLLARQEAIRYEEHGYYTDKVTMSRDWISYWDRQKELSHTGLLIDDLYINPDLYWYLNFILIPDKVKKDFAYPTIFDTDIWFFNLIELAELQNKFTVGVKKRQIGISLKFMAKLIKRIWFQRSFAAKVVSWDKKYVKENWVLLDNYRDELNSRTAWYRGFNPDSNLYWKQVTEQTVEENGVVFKDSRGLKSIIRGITTKDNPTAPVSGKTDEVIFDESGINPNLDETMGFMEPALKFGDLITGNMHIWGAVGKLDQCKPLKKLFYNPEAHNCLALPNIWSNKPHQKVGIFIPEEYSYADCMDEFGNSNIEEAVERIEKEAEAQKKKSYKSYMIYRSQSPRSPDDAFANRSESIYPTHIIKPHKEWLEQNFTPFTATIKREHGRITHIGGSEAPLVTEFPVTPKTDKRGAVVILEPPIKDPPFGLYYAAVDPIKPIQTSSSQSLQSIYIYKSAHEIDGEFSLDRIVAWYTGRHDNWEKTFQTTLDLIEYYNARTAIESDQSGFIEWMIKKKKQLFMMKRSEMPILKDWVPKSKIHEEYGWRTGSGNSTVRDRLIDLTIQYCTEVIDTTFHPETGQPMDVYGVTRIRDIMLLEEMLAYDKGVNVDRIISFGGVLMAARSNTHRGIKVVTTNTQQGSNYKKPIITGLHPTTFRQSSFTNNFSTSAFSRYKKQGYGQ